MAVPASVTHRFTVTVTDSPTFVAPGTKLMTREEAHEVLWQALYQADKHAEFSLSIVEGE